MESCIAVILLGKGLLYLFEVRNKKCLVLVTTLCTAIIASHIFFKTVPYTQGYNRSILNSVRVPYLFPVSTKHYFNFLLSILLSLQQLIKKNHTALSDCVCLLNAQSYPTLCHPVDYSWPYYSIHGIF